MTAQGRRGISPISMAWRHLELRLLVAAAISLLVHVHGITDPEDGTLLLCMAMFLHWAPSLPRSLLESEAWCETNTDSSYSATTCSTKWVSKFSLRIEMSLMCKAHLHDVHLPSLSVLDGRVVAHYLCVLPSCDQVWFGVSASPTLKQSAIRWLRFIWPQLKPPLPGTDILGTAESLPGCCLVLSF